MSVRTVRIALAQMNLIVGDLEGNASRIIDWIAQARDAGADIVAFPELAVTGYPPEDLVLRRSFVLDNLAALDRIAAATAGITAIIGFVDEEASAGAPSTLFNAAALLHDGRIIARYHKQRLPNYGVFDEVRYFRPGIESSVYTVAGAHIGINVCEDIWFEDGPVRDQANAGAEIIININGSPYHRGKGVQREEMIAKRARDNDVAVCYVNLVGGQDELVFDGHSIICDAHGRLLARAAQFREELLVCDIDVGGTRPANAAIVLGNGMPERSIAPLATQITAELDPVAEVWEALVLGVRDYVSKTGFDTVLVGLSGGVDSAVVAAIASDALGSEHVHVVSMPSRFSSEGSMGDACTLAERFGLSIMTIPIEGPFTATLDALQPAFADTQFGVAEENLQARIRGNILMSLSNKFGWLVLTTGNKSEMATGYATLYGDMAGGLAVIKDVLKTLVWDLARYRNRVARYNIIPQAIIDKPPTAELRPDQLDTDSLPPYEVLDPILEAYVEDDRSVSDIVEMGYDDAIVRRIVGMVDRNEYKRRQAPPGIKITERAFGRDRRLPIANRYRPR